MMEKAYRQAVGYTNEIIVECKTPYMTDSSRGNKTLRNARDDGFG
jgi:hypothetical protein